MPGGNNRAPFPVLSAAQRIRLLPQAMSLAFLLPVLQTAARGDEPEYAALVDAAVASTKQASSGPRCAVGGITCKLPRVVELSATAASPNTCVGLLPRLFCCGLASYGRAGVTARQQLQSDPYPVCGVPVCKEGPGRASPREWRKAHI